MALAKKKQKKKTVPSPEELQEARAHLGPLVADLSRHKRNMADHVTAALFDRLAKPVKSGWPPGRHTAFKQAVVQHFGDHFPDSVHLNDAAFKVFLGKMALRYAREQGTQLSIDLYLALIDFCLAAFDLLKEAKLPATILKKYAHQFSLPEIQQILEGIESTFGADPKTRSLVRTAAHLVFSKKYPSADVAKATYDQALQEAEKGFGEGEETQPLVRTVARLVLSKVYPSATAAKEAYDTALQEAQMIFGGEEETQPLVRTVAYLLLEKRYRSVAAAKEMYDDIRSAVHSLDYGAPDARRTKILDLWKKPQKFETQSLLKRYKDLEQKRITPAARSAALVTGAQAR